ETAQVIERVDAGVVPILPDRLDGVAPDLVQIDEAGLLGRELAGELERAGSAHLAAAGRAGAVPAQQLPAVAAAVAVGPLDLDRPPSGEDGDVDWPRAFAHRPSIRGRLAGDPTPAARRATRRRCDGSGARAARQRRRSRPGCGCWTRRPSCRSAS